MIDTRSPEFVQGEVFVMTSGEDLDDIVAMDLVMALRQHLRGTPQRVCASDVKLRLDQADCFFYPDVMVTCSAADQARADAGRIRRKWSSNEPLGRVGSRPADGSRRLYSSTIRNIIRPALPKEI